ncbi:PF20097 family protein [Blastopirellula sp. JC732]|uniref:PF20097 family protein n=1 Tax=Blastopirellula sediminis TaxID=2894196 RepID=A0A9X1SHS8_9BACT|nr:PF20097 family protein [Blastopirellula sediminis]MCC9605923.1 PF20097 family protein [Blastopirellula sediminis]MCC9630778.1 PF20097 family protein [Blastopirellula sediminis]
MTEPTENSSAENPFASPKCDTPDRPVRDCPDCQAPMEYGMVTSYAPIKWRILDRSMLERILAGGDEPVVGSDFALRLGPFRSDSFRCRLCGMIIIAPRSQQPDKSPKKK